MGVHNCQKFIKLNTYDLCVLVYIVDFKQYLEDHIINNSYESLHSDLKIQGFDDGSNGS